MLKSLILVLINILVSVVGQLLMKAGMEKVGRIGAEQVSQPLQTLLQIFTTPLILAALPLYAMAMVMWLIVLSRLKLSFAYPLLAMTYVINPFLAQWLLHEKVPPQQWLGIGVIFAGVLMVIQVTK